MAHCMGDAQGVIGPVVFVRNWKELGELGERHPGSPALVDPGLGELDDYSWTSTPLIRYGRTRSITPPTADADQLYTAFLRAGVDDDIGTIDATILRCIDVRTMLRMLERLRLYAHPFTCRVFRHALDLAIAPASVPAVSNSLDLNERTLQRHCKAHGIPRPNAIVALARIFTVERLAAWSGQPSGAVALSLGFSARSNYRRLARRHVGVSPTTVQMRGGARFVEEVIIRKLAPSA